MAIGRVINEHSGLFPDFDEIVKKIGYDVYHSNWEMQLFLQIPNLTKADVLEYFEHFIMDFALNGDGEVDSIFMVINKGLAINNPNPTYISEHINVVGQLFLAGYIEFGMCGLQDKEENLLSKQKPDKYQSWIHFRDNFFYAEAYYKDILDLRERYPNMSDDDYINSTWNTPKYWDMEHFWVARTPKGTKYFNEILSPKFYNKYKDLEVEIDDKGNIIRWIGKINR